jgi:hypothetical protein
MKCPSGFACLEQFNNKTVLKPGENAIVKIPAATEMTGGAAWMGFDEGDVPSWRKGQSADDNLCSLIEWTIGESHIYYDISAVEGLCGGYSMSWFPDNKKSPKSEFTDVTCRVPGSGNLASDKEKFYLEDINADEICVPGTKNPACLAACPFKKGADKMACHNWIKKTSYDSGGYCGKLYDNKCQAYCWAYDEMMCPSGDTCTYDRNGNPVLPEGKLSYNPMDHSKHDNMAWKTIDGARTTPAVKREKGTLIVEFYPKGDLSSLKPIPYKTPSPSPSPNKLTPPAPPHSGAGVGCDPKAVPAQLCPGNPPGPCPPSGWCPV